MLTAFCGIKLLSFDCEYIHMFVDIFWMIAWWENENGKVGAGVSFLCVACCKELTLFMQFVT